MKSIRSTQLARALGAAALALGLAMTGLAPANALVAPAKHDSKQVINYVNLGDSYSAGFGSGNLREGPIPDCVQGDGPSHVTKVASKAKMKLTLDIACAGYTSAQIGQVASMIKPELQKAKLVTLTLGGNDLDLRELVLACSNFGSNKDCDALVKTNTKRLPSLAKSVNGTLRTVDKATRGQIIVLGYPRIFTTTGGDNQFITVRNAKKLNKLADGLNKAVAKGTRGTSAEFASVTKQFNNHGFGSANPWIYMNPADPGDPLSLHPTTTGYVKGYYPVLERHLDFRGHKRR